MTDDEHVSDDLLLTAALGTGPQGADEDRVARHLIRCPRCRATHAALVEAVDLTLAATPRVAPPPGFESRVLEALRAAAPRPPEVPRPEPAPPAGPARAGTASNRRRLRDRAPSRWLVAAAGIVVGVALGAGGVQLLTTPEDLPVEATALMTDSGRTVGTVSGTDGLEGPQLVVALRRDPPGSTVVCRAVLADGSIRELARWPVGSYAGATWVIDHPAHARLVELTDESGTVWASAEL